MDTYLQQPVRYDSSRRVRRVMNQQVMEAIDGFMARNRSNAAAGLHKQRMRKIDMWRRLRRSRHRDCLFDGMPVCPCIGSGGARSGQVPGGVHPPGV